MKALILSGGKGTRLRPLTYTRAKQLVPVANKPILFYGIESLVEAGIRDFGFIVGDTKDEIMRAVGDGSRWGITVTFIEQEAPLGLAHAVKIARDFLDGDRFVMYLGDNLIFESLAPLIKRYAESRTNAMILLTEVPNPEQFGVAELRDGAVISLEEKPKEPKSNLALVGVYLFDSNVFEAIDRIKPSCRNELEITDAIQTLIDGGRRVEPHIIRGWWKDTGRLEDILEANRLILERLDAHCDGLTEGATSIMGRVSISGGAKIINSTIRGPVIIGENCRIEDAYVGPFTSIQHDVTLRNCEIEHSIVLEHSNIVDLGRRIEDSLIGRNVRITRSQKKPAAFRFMVGDNSEVGVD